MDLEHSGDPPGSATGAIRKDLLRPSVIAGNPHYSGLQDYVTTPRRTEHTWQQPQRLGLAGERVTGLGTPGRRDSGGHGPLTSTVLAGQQHCAHYIPLDRLSLVEEQTEAGYS